MTQTASVESVTCPWCKAAYDITPTSSAKAFKCPKCAEPSTLGALRNPDHRPNAPQLSAATSIAATENLYRHTAAYVFTNRKGEEKVASGTLVQIGGRILLATVAHTSPRSLESIALVKKSRLMTPEPLTCVIRRATSNVADVAVFEIQADAVAIAGLEPIGVERIYDGGPGTSNFKARLIGYPDTWVLPNTSIPGLRAFHGLSYGCEPIDPARWVAIRGHSQLFDEHLHVVLEFSRDVIDCGPKLAVPDGTPDPYGMSGGGLWQRNEAIKSNELWTAEGLCLFGIQSSWLTELEFLKAIQIIHWLKLVADEYPDLRDELNDRFPRIRESE
jgi:hypothetical protein